MASAWRCRLPTPGIWRHSFLVPSRALLSLHVTKRPWAARHLNVPDGWNLRAGIGHERAAGRGCPGPGRGGWSLLAGWARSGRRPAAWLSLDNGDNAPARFWRHAVAALDQACSGIAERVGPLLGPLAPASFQGLVTALINDLSAQPGDNGVLLVLDDYHLTGSQPVHASLAFLLEYRPSGLGVVLASLAAQMRVASGPNGVGHIPAHVGRTILKG